MPLHAGFTGLQWLFFPAFQLNSRPLSDVTVGAGVAPLTTAAHERVGVSSMLDNIRAMW